MKPESQDDIPCDVSNNSNNTDATNDVVTTNNNDEPTNNNDESTNNNEESDGHSTTNVQPYRTRLGRQILKPLRYR